MDKQLSNNPVPPKRPFLGGVIIPTVYVLILGIIMTVLFAYNQPVYQYIQTHPQLQVAPLGTSGAGQVGFDLIYLLISIAAVFGLTAALVRKKVKDKYFWGVAVFFLITAELISINGVWYFISASFVAAFLVGLWLLYVLAAAGKIHRAFTLPFVTAYTTSAAMALTLVLPPLTLLVLPVFFSIWDIWAVKRGPMVKLATGLMQLNKLQNLFLARVGAINLGLADLLFYGLMVGLSLTFGPRAGRLGIGFMLAGFWITVVFLRDGRFKALPGLPVPTFLCLVGLGLSFITGPSWLLP